MPRSAICTTLGCVRLAARRASSRKCSTAAGSAACAALSTLSAMRFSKPASPVDLREIDLGHAAFAERAQDLEAADGAALGRRRAAGGDRRRGRRRLRHRGGRDRRGRRLAQDQDRAGDEPDGEDQAGEAEVRLLRLDGERDTGRAGDRRRRHRGVGRRRFGAERDRARRRGQRHAPERARRRARRPEVDRLRHGDDAGELVGAIVRRHRDHVDELGAVARRGHDHAVLGRRHRRRRLGDARERDHAPVLLEALQDLDALARLRREGQLARAQVAHRRRIGRQRAEQRPHLGQPLGALGRRRPGRLHRARHRVARRGHLARRRLDVARGHHRRAGDAGREQEDAEDLTCHAPLRTCRSPAAPHVRARRRRPRSPSA